MCSTVYDIDKLIPLSPEAMEEPDRLYLLNEMTDMQCKQSSKAENARYTYHVSPDCKCGERMCCNSKTSSAPGSSP